MSVRFTCVIAVFLLFAFSCESQANQPSEETPQAAPQPEGLKPAQHQDSQWTSVIDGALSKIV